MSHLPSFSFTASLLADPARATMLTTLLDGRALPAGELAYASRRHRADREPPILPNCLAAPAFGRDRGAPSLLCLAGAHVAQAAGAAGGDPAARIRPAKVAHPGGAGA